jgi:lipooligosaccharide transport system ATP-binding protein
MEPLVTNQLRKSYGTHVAVDKVSLEIPEGTCVGLLGPNGAGKTTALRICLGLTLADSGSAHLFGMPMPASALKVRQRLGVVPQANMLDPDFNCAENLLVFGRYFGLDKMTISKRIPQLLEFANLTERADELIVNLSGGMQRRLTLARALINDPDMIFLDEPTTGLDPQARHLIWERLRGLQERNKTLLLVTHFLEEAERLCDFVYVMDHGRVIVSGSPGELVHKHVEPEVIELQGREGTHWIKDNAALFSRSESFGSVSYCYCQDSKPVLAALGRSSVHFSHRSSNLEDVFLRLTGRALRE